MFIEPTHFQVIFWWAQFVCHSSDHAHDFFQHGCVVIHTVKDTHSSVATRCFSLNVGCVFTVCVGGLSIWLFVWWIGSSWVLMVHVCVVSEWRMNMKSSLLSLYPWRLGMPRRGAMATTNSVAERVCIGHCAKQAFFSCARNSEIIAAVLVGSVTNFDTVVASFLPKLIFLGEGFAGVSIVWQVTSVHCLRFHWWVPSDLFRIWQDGFRVDGVIVEWLSGMGLLCVVPCGGSMNWNLIEMMLSVILYGFFGNVDVTRN